MITIENVVLFIYPTKWHKRRHAPQGELKVGLGLIGDGALVGVSAEAEKVIGVKSELLPQNSAVNYQITSDLNGETLSSHQLRDSPPLKVHALSPTLQSTHKFLIGKRDDGPR
jgi:hypothetical protein